MSEEQKQNTQQQEDKTKQEPQVQQTDEPKENGKSKEIPKTYQSIISQQKEQIDALMQQNDLLNAQITKMVQNGTQLNDNTSPKQHDTNTSLSDDYVSLSDLGKEIGTNR